MSTVKDSILALFDDNVVGAISAQDMRIFVDAIFDSKENEIHVFDSIQGVEVYRVNNEYPIEQFDIIVITDSNNPNQITDRGLYLALKANPGRNDLFKIGNVNYDEFIKTGTTGQLISLDSNQELTWIEPLEGYYIEGTARISEILAMRPDQRGPVWIASDDDDLAQVPGKTGDGYSWTGTNWVNVGQLRGPAGDVAEVAFATQFEVDAGVSDDRAISPLTFHNSSQLNNKEDWLHNPSTDGMMLTSTTQGARHWETAVRVFGDLEDVDTTNVLPGSFVYYQDSTNGWQTELITNVAINQFIKLTDTPPSYTGQIGKGLVVNGQGNGLTFADYVYNSRNLNDFSNAIPSTDQILIFSSANEWQPSQRWDSGVTNQRPPNAIIGTMFYDTTLNQPIWFNGNTWVDSTGSSVDNP